MLNEGVMKLHPYQQKLGCYLRRLALSLSLLWASDAAGSSIGTVYIPDGQIMTNPVRVYVSDVEISLSDKPKLHAYSSNSIKDPVKAEFEPSEVVSKTEFTTRDGVKKQGTLLLFNFTRERLSTHKNKGFNAPFSILN